MSEKPAKVADVLALIARFRMRAKWAALQCHNPLLNDEEKQAYCGLSIAFDVMADNLVDAVGARAAQAAEDVADTIVDKARGGGELAAKLAEETLSGKALVELPDINVGIDPKPIAAALVVIAALGVGAWVWTEQTRRGQR